MSRIPIPGPHGAMSWIETDQEPMTAEQQTEQARIRTELDNKLVGFFYKKLQALGHSSTFEEAKTMYNDPGMRKDIEGKHRELENINSIAELVGRTELLQRNLKR